MIVFRTFAAPAAARRRRRKKRAGAVDPAADPLVPLTELTWIDAEPLSEDAEGWLERIADDPAGLDEISARALADATRALAAHRVATADGNVPDVNRENVLSIRVGYGSGDRLADGFFEAAVELPRERLKQTRTAALRPQERHAALLGGRERALVGEELLLRARRDLDGGRSREAALQIRIALEALLAEREAISGAGQDADLAALDERRRATGEAANAALEGDLDPARVEDLEETIKICERVLRRRSARVE